MKIPFTIIALFVITSLPNVIPQRSLHDVQIDSSNQTRRVTRQTNADQMVQNILHWLQGVHTMSDRKVRQEGLRTYLPPTQRPRPFEPAPPEDNLIPGIAPPHMVPSALPGLFEEPLSLPHQPGVIPQLSAQESKPNEKQDYPGIPPAYTEEPAITTSTSSGPQHEVTKLPGEEPLETSEPAQPLPEYSGPDESSTIDHAPGGEISQEPLPSVGPPSLPSSGEQVIIGYPPAGETPYPPFPPIADEPGEPSVTGYPSAGEVPHPPFSPIESSSPPFITGPDVTGYPAGETSQSPVLPTESPSPPTAIEAEENGYQPVIGGDVTGYPPAGGTPQPPFTPIGTPSSPLSEKTEHGPTPSQPLEGEEIPSSSPEDEGPDSSPLPPEPTGYPSVEITSGSEEPIVFTEPTDSTPAHETPQQPSIPEGAPEIFAVPPQETPSRVSGESTTFPPLEREIIDKPEETSQSGTEAPNPTVPSSPTEESTLLESYQTPLLPEVNSVAPTANIEITEPDETPSQPSFPEVNVSELEPTKAGNEEIGTTPDDVITPSEEDLNHPPHVHSIDVECAKDMMTINIEFNRNFEGIIYSKGFYTNPECRYVNENAGRSKYTFTVKLDSCGTQFVNGFDKEGQSYLENVLVLQNELGIQEVWDTVRSVRCLWEGSLKKSLSVSLSVGMLSEEIVTFSGDTAVARLDIQRGEGPFAPTATGLVPIGEKMTLVISVSGDPGFDIQVKDCKALDETGDLQYPLTDEDGCVLRPKLFGAFQKTNNTGNLDASIIAYAFFKAFKFPDLMDLMIECNIELCKIDCDVCPNPDQKIQPGKRKRRGVYNESLGEPVKVGKLLRVFLPQDLSEGEAVVELKDRKELCISVSSFVYASVILISLLACSFLLSGYMLLKHRNTSNKHQF